MIGTPGLGREAANAWLAAGRGNGGAVAGDDDGRLGSKEAAAAARGVDRRAGRRPSRQAISTSKPPRARRPVTCPPARRRQRGQQVELAGMALQQHLGDAGRRAEVAVDLKRRVRVEQVGVDATAA